MNKFLMIILFAAIAAVAATVIAKSLDIEHSAAIGGGVGGAIGAVLSSSKKKGG